MSGPKQVGPRRLHAPGPCIEGTIFDAFGTVAISAAVLPRQRFVPSERKDQMATSITCDYCGEPIAEGVYHDAVELIARGTHGIIGSTTLGQYHKTYERPCWDEILDRISMIHDISADLKPQPTPRQPTPRPAPVQKDPQLIALREARARWLRTEQPQRAAVFLRALAGDALIGAEVAERMNAELGAELGGRSVVYTSNIRQLAIWMVREGLLEAEQEIYRGRVRYRYSSPERAFHDDAEVA